MLEVSGVTLLFLHVSSGLLIHMQESLIIILLSSMSRRTNLDKYRVRFKCLSFQGNEVLHCEWCFYCEV